MPEKIIAQSQPNQESDAAAKYASPLSTKSWHELLSLARKLKHVSITDLRKQDPDFTNSLILHSKGITLDASRNLVNRDVMKTLISLAHEMKVESWRDAMFSGRKINIFEDRSVLHTALRQPEDQDSSLKDTTASAAAGVNAKDRAIRSQHEDKNPARARGDKGEPGAIHGSPDDSSVSVARGEDPAYAARQAAKVRRDMKRFCARVHEEGKFTDIVNIGIGGSYLGPEMVYMALSASRLPGIRVHFVSNIDGHDIDQTLDTLQPGRTLFLVASKTFTTQETMTNALTARRWIVQGLGEAAVCDHFVALSSNTEKAADFGISLEHIFPFWDWVGGRFSLWSSIGLSIALGTGWDQFQELLDGAHAMDNHFACTPLEENMPVLLALVGLWYRSFLDAPALAVLPYDQRLARFPAFLQQLDMESNGKSVDRNNQSIDYPTGPVVFGEPGTNGQHAFYQMMHQGTTLIPSDFITCIQPDHAYPEHHRILLSHMLAQASALMQGRSLEEAKGNAQKYFSGNRPSNLILLQRLTPFHLGQLIALYEHKILVQGVLWNLNSFDQWGVELGKEIAGTILRTWQTGDTSSLDPLTAATLGSINKNLNKD